ncbi:MATE family efflux transporter [Pseudotabrizicola sediminis]|uniref:MATE family efflux transporter n=1 Tax=Pseudotabrizicola sediminis TaxID=2486418 RepID=A0ABY2KNW3_9RHOB|nr:MATE family efflux transporter [Pseudotabrizicola sediminis]TGD44288.1 MATE family efflux transporter [Pseudotabrizicola sediminis]
MSGGVGAAVGTAGAAPRFVTGNLMRHVVVMSLTSSVGLMAIFSVDLINILYISWLQDPVATAAVGYAGAVLFFTTSFGIGISIAVSAVVARALGQRDVMLARRRATNGLMLGLGLGIGFTAVVWVLLGPIVGLLGATGPTAEATVHYLSLSMLGQPFLMLGITGAGVLRSHGDARRAMMVTVWGAVVLAIADPILIFGFGWGLPGAAWAANLSRLVIAGMAIWPLWRRHGGFTRVTAAGLAEDIRAMAGIAGSAVLTQVATPVGQAFVTRMIAPYGEAAVAGMAITGRLTPVALGVIFALAGAVGPIVGQNAGAGRMDRVRRTVWDSVIFTAVVISLVTLVLFGLRGPTADLFHAEGVTRDLVFLFCGPLALLFFFNGLLFISNAACNNLGRPFLSTLLNWGRHTLGTIPFALWFAGVWGAEGVLIGQAAGGVIFGIVSLLLVFRVIDQHGNTTGDPHRA